VLYKQIWTAFLANPFLNALIIFALAFGIVFAYRQVMRLFPEVNWVKRLQAADPGPRGRAPARAAGAHGGPAARSHQGA